MMLSEFILKVSEESLAKTKRGVSLAARISQAFVNCLPFGCFDSAGGWMVEKNGIRNEVAILDSPG